MHLTKILAGAALALAATLSAATVAQAGVSLSGTVTYYSGFSETYGTGITFSSATGSDAFTSINNTADYGGSNSTPGWMNGNTLYGADFLGTITAPSAGNYTFSFGADDAAYIFLNGSTTPAAFIGGGNDFCCSGAPRDITLSLGTSTPFEIQYANEFQNQTALVFQAVPEPATWAFMLVGVGMIGAGLRMARRKNDLALNLA